MRLAVEFLLITNANYRKSDDFVTHLLRETDDFPKYRKYHIIKKKVFIIEAKLALVNLLSHLTYQARSP